MSYIEKNLNPNAYLGEDKSEILDLAFLWRLIQSRRWFILTITAVVFTLSVIYRYKSCELQYSRMLLSGSLDFEKILTCRSPTIGNRSSRISNTSLFCLF